ncbi:MAG: hypothetical protein LAP38_04420 [Acidobacteriia bacterium]|nr:hypothetical protein [Terriglobia bacterium]
MKRWSLPIALYLFVVFVSGAVVGALGYRTYNPPPSSSNTVRNPNPEEWRRQYLQELRTRVNMTDDQIQKVEGMLDQTRANFRDARTKHNDAVKQIGEQYREMVRSLLTPDQVPKYEQFRQERDQRMKQQQPKR